MYVKRTSFTIGTDPEVFLWHVVKRKFVGAYGVTHGTKERPAILDGFFNTVQVDGMALEINTPLRYSADQFGYACSVSRRSLRKLVGKGKRIKIVPTAEFDDDEWERMPEEVKILGCDPDFNAWSGDINEPPNADVKFRTGAGHIHIGWGKGFTINDNYKHICQEVIKEQDALNGVASLLYDQDTKRRDLYGKAGAFRPKAYGVEYRTLSNSWFRNSALTGYVARRTFQGVRNLMFKRPINTPEVEDIINENKVDEAIYFLEHHKVTLPPKQYRVV